MDNGRQSHSSSMPLVPRLDRLDSILRYLEGKQNLSILRSDNSAGGVKRQCMPLDLAVREAHSKGSLLDRVASLEHRLFQLCLEMESSSTMRTSIVQTTSGHGSKRESSCSFPTFNKPNQGYKESQVYVNRFEFQGKSHRKQQRLKHPGSFNQKLGNNSDEKQCKSGKKGMPPNWSHLRILGC